MRNMVVSLLIIGLLVLSLVIMPGTGAEILAQVHVPTIESQGESAKLKALNPESWGYWGPQRYWTELQ